MTMTLHATEYLQTKDALDKCEAQNSGGFLSFDGYVTGAVVQALREAGFVGAPEDEGYHTGKLAMGCFKKPGWKASVTQANFMGRFTQVEIRSIA
jgi:hypothetical protein